MKRITNKFFSLFVAFTLAFGLVANITQPVSAAGTVSLDALDSAYTQNFNTLASSGISVQSQQDGHFTKLGHWLITYI